MSVHVIDGANGFVASHLIGALLGRGEEVIGLARASRDVVCRSVRDALLCLGLDGALVARLRVCRLALDRPGLGLPVAEVFAERCVYWHTVALITFFPGREEELHSVNVAGAANVLATFERYSLPGSRFIAIGTAYQCGLSTECTVPEDWPVHAPPDRFRNFYEYSKREAEIALARSRSVLSGAGAVARLGMMVGHSRTGRALTGHGLYDFLRVMAFFARRNPGEQVRIPCHPNANLHLSPIDVTVARLLPLATGVLRHPVFHVVDSGAVPASDFFAVVNNRLPMTLVPATPEEIRQNPFNRFEAVVNMRARYTAAYLRHHFDFELRGGSQPPAVTPDVLDRLVASYISEGLPES